MCYEMIGDAEMKSIVGGSVAQLATVLAVGAIALITITVFKLYQSTNGKSSFGSGFEFEWEIKD
jgi:hypothetical protein